MTITRYGILAAAVLIAFPSVVQAQVVNDSELTVLDPGERARYETRVRNAESEVEGNRIRAEIRSRIEARKAYNAAVPEGARDTVSARVREAFENRFMRANSDVEKEQIGDELKAQVQTRVRERVQVRSQSKTDDTAVQTRTREEMRHRENPPEGAADPTGSDNVNSSSGGDSGQGGSGGGGSGNGGSDGGGNGGSGSGGR